MEHGHSNETPQGPPPEPSGNLPPPPKASKGTVTSDAETPSISEISPPMLDVHAPHETVHTWKDFFVHIATIVVGLVIAVGIEQSVEAIRHRHERSDLRETLRRESEQILKDSRNTTVAIVYHHDWLGRRIDQVKAAVWRKLPLAEPAAYSRPNFDYPDDPLWRSAKISGLVERLGADFQLARLNLR